jgi:hypothetical protein
VRAVFAIAALEDIELCSVNMSHAYLNGEFEEEIYMQQSEGFEVGGPHHVCKLHKLLYGSQASRQSLEQEIVLHPIRNIQNWRNGHFVNHCKEPFCSKMASLFQFIFTHSNSPQQSKPLHQMEFEVVQHIVPYDVIYSLLNSTSHAM